MSQIVTSAIRESKSTTSVITIDESDAKQASTSLAAVRGELFDACDGDVDRGDGVHEYWGKDVDGVEWRVHVRA